MQVRCPFCGAETDAADEVDELDCPSCRQPFSVLREAETITEPQESQTSTADAATITRPRVRVNCFECGKEFTIPLGEAGAACPRCGAPYSIADKEPGADAAPESAATAKTVVSGRPSSPFAEERQRSAQASLRWLQEHFEGRYEVLDFVSRGGMGAVFRARQKQPSREVAMKVMLGGAFATDTNRKRFEREAHAVARLNHPAIVPVYEFGEVGGQPYFTMEFVQGKNLRSYAAEHSLSREQICRLMVRVCDAIHYAHKQGVIHRDLKPGNILVDSLQRARILDFGLSRASVEGDGRYDGLTVTGDYMGTPRYMSPEQAMGSPRAIDERTDVYSLGVILYELIVGVLPYPIERARGLKAYEMLQNYEPLRPSALHPNIPGDLEIILLKAVQKDKDMRYQTAEALAQDLESYLEDRPIMARPATLSYRFNKWAWRQRRILVPACLAAAVVAALSFAYWRRTVRLHTALQQTGGELQTRTRESMDRRATAQSKRGQVAEHIARDEWQAAAAVADTLASTYATDLVLRGLPEFVRRRAAGRVRRALEDYAALIREQSYEEAQAAAKQLSALALLMPYEDLSARLRPVEADFEQTCWADLRAAVEEAYVPGEAVDRIRRFIEGRPASPHRQEAAELLAGQEGLDTEHFLAQHQRAVERSLEARHWGAAAAALASADQALASADTQQAGRWQAVFADLREGLDTVIRPGTAAKVVEVAPSLSPGGWVRALEFAPDGSWFVAAAYPDNVSLWSWPQRKEVRAWRTEGELRSAAVSVDGRQIAIGTKGGLIQIWSAVDGALVVQLDAGPDWVSALQFAPDGRRLMSADAGGVTMWEPATGQRTGDRLAGATRPAALSPDGSYVAAALSDVGAGIWRVGREDPLFPIPITGLPSSALMFSPDGSVVATAHTGDNQRKVRLWDTTWGEPLRELAVSTGSEPTLTRLAWGLAFTPGGKVLATGDSSGTVKLWDVTTGEMLHRFTAHTAAVTCAAFAPDGRALLTGSNDRTVRFWGIAGP